MHDLTNQPCGYDISRAGDSDALVIARWCWPDQVWRDGLTGVERQFGPGLGWAIYSSFWHEVYDAEEGLYGVADAERILIERGHAEAYGRALLDALPDPHPPQFVEAIALCIAMPPPARVKVMASVIRSLP